MEEPRPRILLVDDDERIIVLMQLYLDELADVFVASDGLTGLKRAVEVQPDLILLDAGLPDIPGLEVCNSLLQNVLTQHIPIIFLTGESDQEFEMQVFETGAADYLQKPITPERVLMRLRVHLRAKFLNDRLREQARTDSLTGLLNRRVFNQDLDREWRRALRFKHALEFFVLDIDRFKSINDEWGHAAGDDCLQLVATQLKQLNTRGTDQVYRMGGEEFAIIHISNGTDSLEHQAERLVQGLHIADWPASIARHPPELTTSVGAVRVEFGGDPAETWHTLTGPEQLVSLADGLLYKAKDMGRNTYQSARALCSVS